MSLEKPYRMPPIRTFTLVLRVLTAITVLIFVLLNFQATQAIAAVVGIPGVWIGSLFAVGGHDIQQVIAVLLGELIWFLALSFGLASSYQWLSRRAKRIKD